MTNQGVTRDERTLVVENASYRLAYLVLSFGLLLIVAYRGLVRDESSWDLLALVMLGGMVTTFYQATQRVFTRRSLLAGVLVAAVAAVVAAALVLWQVG